MPLLINVAVINNNAILKIPMTFQCPTKILNAVI